MSGSRLNRSCQQCRQRKRKCDRELPCGQCITGERECVFEAESQVFVIVGGNSNSFFNADVKAPAPVSEEKVLSTVHHPSFILNDVITSSTRSFSRRREAIVPLITDVVDKSPRSNRMHCSHETFQWQAASCNICIASGIVDDPKTRGYGTNGAPNYHTGFGECNGKPVYSPCSIFSHDPHEQMALQYFHNVVAKDVSGFISIGFWEHLVPQMCQMDDTAQQVAIALSLAHRERATIVLSPPPNASRKMPESTFCIESELKAHRALRRYIETTSSPSYELVLACSIMLHTLDSMCRREASAILHVKNALQIFKAWQTARKQVGSEGDPTAVRSLSIVLARLDVSLTIATDGKRLPAFEYDHCIPAMLSHEALVANLKFSEPYDAYYQLGRVSTPATVFMIQNRQWFGKDASSIPRQILEKQREHLGRFRAWDIAMGSYESDWLCYSGANDRSVGVMSLLAARIVHWSAEKLVAEFVRDDNNICPWDRTPQKLLNFTGDLIGYMEKVRPANDHLGHTSFSPEVAVCSFLMTLAGRTTLPYIRTKALELAKRFNQKQGVRELVRTFIRWIDLPHPKATFPFFLGKEGTERALDVIWCSKGLGLQAASWTTPTQETSCESQ